MKKLGISFFLGVIFLALSFGVSLAAERCETLYGGGETCVRTGELQIDKEIWDPQNDHYVDNLGVTSYKFGTAEEIKFSLIVKNVGDETLEDIKVVDELPEYLFFTNGSDDTYYIDHLNPGDSEEIIVYAQVKAESQLPADKSLVCVVNVGEAWADDEHDRDTAQLCITKKVLGITTLPKTGAGEVIYITIFFVFTALIGLLLMRLNRKP